MIETWDDVTPERQTVWDMNEDTLITCDTEEIRRMRQSNLRVPLTNAERIYLSVFKGIPVNIVNILDGADDNVKRLLQGFYT